MRPLISLRPFAWLSIAVTLLLFSLASCEKQNTTKPKEENIPATKDIYYYNTSVF